jgi:peptidoglycan/LPS O-acetylase OafA/YrhL
LGCAFTPVLRARLPVLIGRISYGGYLFHGLILWAMTAAIGRDKDLMSIGARGSLFGAVWGLTLLLAYASFYGFETPIERWSRKPREVRPERVSASISGLTEHPAGERVSVV